LREIQCRSNPYENSFFFFNSICCSNKAPIFIVQQEIQRCFEQHEKILSTVLINMNKKMIEPDFLRQFNLISY